MFQAVMTIGQVNWDCLVAQTSAEQTQGLSNTSTLSNGTAMVFPFGSLGSHVINNVVLINMIEMNYPLDILFLDANGVIKNISRNVPIGSNFSAVADPTVVTFVEMNAGESTGLSVNDVAQFDPALPIPTQATFDLNAIINLMMVVMIMKMMGSAMSPNKNPAYSMGMPRGNKNPAYELGMPEEY